MHVIKMKIVLLIIVIAFIELSEQERDYYEMLGLERSADSREIRKAFKRLALQLHPDKNVGKPKANEQFAQIIRAYEVLKNEKTRNVYDTHGEAGLNDDQRNYGRYQEYDYYHNSFGIYDDDEEIITLSAAHFHESVGKGDDDYVWFINFYSPRCSHCHVLAPEWKKMARDMHNIVRIGAVNCGDDLQLCRQQNIRSYPSLILYPANLKFQGERKAQELVKFILHNLKVERTQYSSLKSFTRAHAKTTNMSLVIVCHDHTDCLPSDTIKLLSYKLKHLANVFEVECDSSVADDNICRHWGWPQSQLIVFSQINHHPDVFQSIKLQDVGAKAGDIFKTIVSHFPEVPLMSQDMFQSITECLLRNNSAVGCQKALARNCLVVLLNAKSKIEEIEHELRSLSTILPEVNVFKFFCDSNAVSRGLCGQMFVTKYPSVIFIKQGVCAYEHYHGRLNCVDLANFARKSSESSIVTLNPETFTSMVVNDASPWLIEFHSPWCPMCKTIMQSIREASMHGFDRKVNVGTIDCTIHASMCRDYNIKSYPTVLLYNSTTPHQFLVSTKHQFLVSTNSHPLRQDLIDFIDNILHNHVIELNPITFSGLVENRQADEIWVVDFFSPFCRPCLYFAPTLAKLARHVARVEKNAHFNIASLNCARWKSFCHKLDIHSYPSVRLYPSLQDNNHQLSFYNFDMNSPSMEMILTWMYEFYPASNVKEIYDDDEFEEMLTSSSSHLVNFYTPWSSNSLTLWPDFCGMSKNLSSIQFIRLNCARLEHLCRQAHIQHFPAIRFYEGSRKERRQPYQGKAMAIDDVDRLENILRSLVTDQITLKAKDEL